MLHLTKHMLALALVAGVAAAPITSWAAPKAKDERVKVAQSSGSSDFEENRKAHAAKSKENNEKKGAN